MKAKTTFEDLEKFVMEQLKDLGRKQDKNIVTRAAIVLTARIQNWINAEKLSIEREFKSP